MNPMAQAALTSILRWGLAILAGYLVKHGIWTESDASGYVAAAALALVSLGWAQRTVFMNRLKLLTALIMPAGTTEAAVEDHIASQLPVPSVATPTTATPVPVSKG